MFLDEHISLETSPERDARERMVTQQGEAASQIGASSLLRLASSLQKLAALVDSARWLTQAGTLCAQSLHSPARLTSTRLLSLAGSELSCLGLRASRC
jgi:hypothetical protein